MYVHASRKKQFLVLLKLCHNCGAKLKLFGRSDSNPSPESAGNREEIEVIILFTSNL